MAEDKKEELFLKVKSIIVKQLGVDETKITLQSKLNEGLGADSLDATELVMALEEEFNIEILDEVAEKMLTVSDIIEYLSKQNLSP